MKFYLEKRVLFGFILALSILVGLSYYSFLNNQRFTETSRMVAHTNEVLFHLEQSKSVAFQLESLILKYVISGDTSFLITYKTELDSGARHVVNVIRLTKDNQEQQIRLDSLRHNGRKKIRYNQKVIEARKRSISEAQKLIPSVQNGKIQSRLIELMDEIQSAEQTLLDERSLQNEKNQIRFYTAFSLLLIATCVILILVFMAINNGLNARTAAELRTKQLNKELEAFTYSVSHDLRAPLRSVDGYARVLFEDYGDKFDAEGHRVLGVIMSNAKKMGNLIDDMLEFSRIGRKEVNKGLLDMKTIVDEIIKQESNNHVSFTVKDLVPVRGDQNLIRQVWVNLISNAVKYSSKKEKPHVEISSYKQDGKTVYCIKDNGVGFDMQYVHKLFGVFQRLHHTKDFEGTGVGLALVYRIIQKHGGDVWAEAEVNKGAAFYFSLPA